MATLESATMTAARFPSEDLSRRLTHFAQKQSLWERLYTSYWSDEMEGEQGRISRRMRLVKMKEEATKSRKWVCEGRRAKRDGRLSIFISDLSLGNKYLFVKLPGRCKWTVGGTAGKFTKASCLALASALLCTPCFDLLLPLLLDEAAALSLSLFSLSSEAAGEVLLAA